MKKKKVYELAKAKGLSNHAVIEILKKKGFKKVTAITYVPEDVLDGAAGPEETKSFGAKVSHLFGSPSRPAAATAVAKPSVQAVAEKKETPAKRPDNKKPKPKEAAPAAAQKAAGGSKKEGSNVLSIVAMAVSVAVLVLAGFIYNGVDSNRARMEKLSTDLQASLNRMDETVTANRAQLLEVQKQVAGTNVKIDGIKAASIATQLKSQSAVLGALVTNLDEPLRTRTKRLSENLAAF